MAKIKAQTANTFQEKPEVNRPGVHAKTKTSNLKSSKLYKKAYRGQGKQMNEQVIIISFFIIYLTFHFGAGVYYTIRKNGKIRSKKNKRQKAG